MNKRFLEKILYSCLFYQKVPVVNTYIIVNLLLNSLNNEISLLEHAIAIDNLTWPLVANL
jgi:hypothetical protein